MKLKGLGRQKLEKKIMEKKKRKKDKQTKKDVFRPTRGFKGDL